MKPLREYEERTKRARDLRRNSTDAELLLWRSLRNRQLHGARFRRQHPIGRYVADFCCVESRLVVELDGGQHAERQHQDELRTRFLEQRGFGVLRFWNHEVFEAIDAVLARIAEKIKDPHPNPLPR